MFKKANSYQVWMAYGINDAESY